MFSFILGVPKSAISDTLGTTGRSGGEHFGRIFRKSSGYVNSFISMVCHEFPGVIEEKPVTIFRKPRTFRSFFCLYIVQSPIGWCNPVMLIF